ncbi:hypothetical protein CB1_001857014 [Camelus ferus]|nr:hypothetical protein CB1_001857014 [Camelus ferus]
MESLAGAMGAGVHPQLFAPYQASQFTKNPEKCPKHKLLSHCVAESQPPCPWSPCDEEAEDPDVESLNSKVTLAFYTLAPMGNKDLQRASPLLKEVKMSPEDNQGMEYILEQILPVVQMAVNGHSNRL